MGGGGHTEYMLVSTPGVGRSPPALTSSGLTLVRQAAQFLSPKTVRSWSYNKLHEMYLVEGPSKLFSTQTKAF